MVISLGIGERRLRTVKCVAKTDRGRRRTDNQDSYGILERSNFRFYMVADGMGGARAGGVASDIAVSVVTHELSLAGMLSVESIRNAVQRANSEIYRVSSERPECRGMGTTICGIGFTDNSVFICNVGDSRLYRLRSGLLTCLTQDHTVAAELVKSGAMSIEVSESSPVAHILTRSLGIEPSVDVDVLELESYPEELDRFLLCSDGLHGMVSEAEIAVILRENTVFDAAEALTSAANAAGGADNITVLSLGVGPFPKTDTTVYDTQQLEIGQLREGALRFLDSPLAFRTSLIGGGLGLISALGLVALSSWWYLPASETSSPRMAHESRLEAGDHSNLTVSAQAPISRNDESSETRQTRARMSRAGYQLQLTDSLASWYRVKASLKGAKLREVKSFLRSHNIDPDDSPQNIRKQVEAEISRILTALILIDKSERLTGDEVSF